MPREKDKVQKQAYEKPRLRIIELAAEEILAVGCKTAPVTPGRGGNGCTNPICSISTGS